MASEQTPPQMSETQPQITSAPLAAPPPPEQTRPYALYSPGHGLPFQPYQGDQSAVEALQNPLPVNKNWQVTKRVLHGLVLVLCICGLGLGLSLVNNFSYQVFVILCCPVLGAGFLWSLAEIITQVLRKFKSGIHPGAHVGITLIVWLITAGLGGFYGVYLADLQNLGSYCANSGDDYDDDGYGYPGYGYDCSNDDHSNVRIASATAAFTLAVGLLYFVLFVGACVDTHRRNAAASKPIVIVAHPQQWGAMPRERQPPMEQTSNEQSTARGNAPEQTHSVMEHYAPGPSSQV